MTAAGSFGEAVRAVRCGADPDAAAGALLARMTEAERLGILDGDEPFWPGMAEMMGKGYNLEPIVAGAVPRLGVPGIRFSDGPRGAVIGRSTAFPVPMARGATWDPALEERVGAAIGAEIRAQGGNLFGGVCVNLLRHPAWGRAQETYGEEPVLLGALGSALARGAQRHVMACVKHFACNSMENARFTVDVRIDEQTLHEVYLPHFRAVVEAGVASVMSAYNSVNGQWCGQNRTLLTDILRTEWGFAGLVVSDFIWGLRDPAGSLAAGLDVEMPFAQQRAVALAPALAAGTVLPLQARQLTRVAVVGRLADVPNTGDHGSSDVRAPSVVTPLAGLREALPGVEVSQVDGAGDTAGFDVAVVIVGYTAEDEGEYVGSYDPALATLYPPPDEPGAHDELARAVAAANSRTVVVVMAGAAVTMEEWRDRVPAILLAWYPGMEGGAALADVLLGRSEPGGRLPFAIPRDEADLPPFERNATTVTYDRWHGQRLLDRDAEPAAYPLGFGLSYTTFTIGNVDLDVQRGGHVVQVYATRPGPEPERFLVGFARGAHASDPGSVPVALALPIEKVDDDATR